jgi:hypothetical protein
MRFLIPLPAVRLLLPRSFLPATRHLFLAQLLASQWRPMMTLESLPPTMRLLLPMALLLPTHHNSSISSGSSLHSDAVATSQPNSSLRSESSTVDQPHGRHEHSPKRAHEETKRAEKWRELQTCTSLKAATEQIYNTNPDHTHSRINRVRKKHAKFVTTKCRGQGLGPKPTRLFRQSPSKPLR